MRPKRRVLQQRVQHFDNALSERSWTTYQLLLTEFLVDYPLEVKNRVLGLVRSKDFEKLLKWADEYENTLTPAEQGDVGRKRQACQLVALIKKYPFPEATLKPKARANAWEKFLQAENRCRRYNLRFRSLEQNERWNSGVEVTRSALRRPRDPHAAVNKLIADYFLKVIGVTPDYDKIYGLCSFGPGASIGVQGNSTNLGRKFLAEKWTCTPSALPFALSALARDQHVQELILPRHGEFFCLDPLEFRKALMGKVELVQHNKIVFVPKTTLVDRTIAVEPLLNGYLQKGVDLFMRQRLKRVGIDLSKQSRNQHLAYLGSLPGQSDPFVTIDLSSASDSISSGVARRFLPYDWYIFMDQLRAKEYRLEGEEKNSPYHKFVSMGNGFCFPLESLLFAAVCAVYSKPNDFIVYGDDIIVRRSVSLQVLQTLKRIGFRHNPKKTFIEGPFRESCGADWLEGSDVRPLTLDAPLSNLSEIIKFYNLSLCKPHLAVQFQQVREFLLGMVPLELQFMRPYKGNVFGAFEVPLDKFQASLFSAWNIDLQCWEWTELDVKGVPDRDLPSVSERYPTVLTMAAVRGSPSSMPFSKRRETRQTVRRIAYAGADSCWLPPETVSRSLIDLDFDHPLA